MRREERDKARDQARISRIRAALLGHYRRHKRDLPWRNTTDPYTIWISEIMLQQTRVETILRRYPEFLRAFPSVTALCAAPVSRVCEAWAGIGYYARARHLHEAAVRIVKEHQGKVPSTVAQLSSLPGIGLYTAGAIASIAFGRREPVVDGNVSRVLCRVFAIGPRIDLPATQTRLWALAAQLVDGPSPGDLNQALMEHGALVCTPRLPRCSDCAICEQCSARKLGRAEDFPRKARRPGVKALSIAMVYLRSQEGLWLAQRPVTGLWAGLWELPSAHGARARTALNQILGVLLPKAAAIVRHELTHRLVTARIYVPPTSPPLRAPDGWRCFREPLSAPLSALARKAILAIEARSKS